MSKAVMHSVSPQQCERIVAGEHTILLSKSRPQMEMPFKCYIYCTKKKYAWHCDTPINGNPHGKVIGEFICDKIGDDGTTMRGRIALSREEIEQYRQGKPLYYWHISDLVIYDKPRELGEFKKPCINNNACANCERSIWNSWDSCFAGCDNRITRPPQSWCYVEV